MPHLGRACLQISACLTNPAFCTPLLRMFAIVLITGKFYVWKSTDGTSWPMNMVHTIHIYCV